MEARNNTPSADWKLSGDAKPFIPTFLRHGQDRGDPVGAFLLPPSSHEIELRKQDGGENCVTPNGQTQGRGRASTGAQTGRGWARGRRHKGGSPAISSTDSASSHSTPLQTYGHPRGQHRGQGGARPQPSSASRRGRAAGHPPPVPSQEERPAPAAGTTFFREYNPTTNTYSNVYTSSMAAYGDALGDAGHDEIEYQDARHVLFQYFFRLYTERSMNKLLTTSGGDVEGSSYATPAPVGPSSRVDSRSVSPPCEGDTVDKSNVRTLVATLGIRSMQDLQEEVESILFADNMSQMMSLVGKSESSAESSDARTGAVARDEKEAVKAKRRQTCRELKLDVQQLDWEVIADSMAQLFTDLFEATTAGTAKDSSTACDPSGQPGPARPGESPPVGIAPHARVGDAYYDGGDHLFLNDDEDLDSEEEAWILEQMLAADAQA